VGRPRPGGAPSVGRGRRSVRGPSPPRYRSPVESGATVAGCRRTYPAAHSPKQMRTKLVHRDCDLVLGRLVARRRRRLRRHVWCLHLCASGHVLTVTSWSCGGRTAPPAGRGRVRTHGSAHDWTWSLDRVGSWNRTVMGNARRGRGGTLVDAVLARHAWGRHALLDPRGPWGADEHTLLESSSASTPRTSGRHEERSEDAVKVPARGADVGHCLSGTVQ
jgi:hypothetical protein